jgi:FdhD protein
MTHHAPGLLIRPSPDDPRLTQKVVGVNEAGERVETQVVVERGLTLYLNAQEIVTMMTIGDYPSIWRSATSSTRTCSKPTTWSPASITTTISQFVVVRTDEKTNFEEKLKKRTQTSGCAQGTAFGDLMEALEDVKLPDAPLKTSWLYRLSHAINTTPSLYLEAGAIHGCVLAPGGPAARLHGGCRPPQRGRQDRGLDVPARESGADKIFYTTGRLTSEMVIKTVRMGIPILVSRSGFTAWGVELARQCGLTLIGRASGKRFVALAGENRIVFDQSLDYVEEESAKHRRKGAGDD